VLTIYVYLKRFSFLGNNYRLHFVYLIVLFRVLHLVIDTRGGDIGEPIKPLAFLNYTCNFLTFPSLVPFSCIRTLPGIIRHCPTARKTS
jgi:hypothetical protein